jgi:hypothetical protein
MCNLYTKAFVKTGMLDSDGRASYQQMPESVCTYVDKQRAVNEIALVNNTTGEVSYGVQSLFKIIGLSFPVFKPLFAFSPFVWFMSKVYAFISYNRRVIIPATHNDFAIQPAFKLHYRIAYLLFTWFCTGFILTHYAPLLTGLVPLGEAYREYLICGGQIIFQAVVIGIYARPKMWDYLGNMMAISFAGSLLLLPGLLIGNFVSHNPLVFTASFMLVAGLMFLEHIRRNKLLGLGIVITCTWVTYRLLILLIILN